MAEGKQKFVDHAANPPSSLEPWLAGLEAFGSGVSDFEPFGFLKDKLSRYYRTPDGQHWLSFPYDFWETRMKDLPQPYSNVVAFPHVIECYDPNEDHLARLIDTIARAPHNAKIVAIMSEIFGRDGLVETGHVFCAVFRRHSDGIGTDIILHDVYSKKRLALIKFFHTQFPKANGYHLNLTEKAGFKFQSCTDHCENVRLDEDSCVMMTHLAAELELRNIAPPRNVVTVNMQKGYAVFLQRPERLYDVAFRLMGFLKERMTELAAGNRPRKEIKFCILGEWFKVSDTFFSDTKVPNTGTVIPLLMNYNLYFFKGDETKEKHEDLLRRIVNELKVSYEADSGFGYVN